MNKMALRTLRAVITFLNSDCNVLVRLYPSYISVHVIHSTALKKTKTKRLNKQKPKEFLWFFKQISLFQCMLLLSLKSRSFPSSACSEGLKYVLQWHCIKSFSCCQNSFPLRIQASIVFIILPVYLKMFNFCFLHEYQEHLPFLPLWSGWWLSFCCWMIVS